MNIVKLTYPPFDNVNSYFIYWGDDEALLIDCVPRCYEKVMRLCKDLNKQVKKVLLTHGHIDHIHDINKIESTGAKVGIHSLDEDKLSTDKHLGKRFGMSILPTESDFILDRRETYLNDHVIKIIHTPGHTAGSVCFEIEDILFTGDTLFRGTVGRTDFEDGSPEDMMSSLKKLKYKYPPSTLVYPGHGLETTLEQECLFNPYMKNL